jgi:alpha/beta superfamily hydrolase
MDKLVDVSGFFKLEVYGIELRPRFVREKLMKLNECEAISKLHDAAVLVVVGDKDDIVGADEAQEIFSSAHDPKDIQIIESADHIYRGKEDELISKTIDWINKVTANCLKNKAYRGSSGTNS